MNPRLVYVVGPSGAGKDSLMAWLLAAVADRRDLQLARRTLTRPPGSPGDEQHEAVSLEGFERLRAQHVFALCWEAHGIQYGVRWSELRPRECRCVLLNGSRADLPEARKAFPDLFVVHVQASATTLAQRLSDRRREPAGEVQQRLHRAQQAALAPTQADLEVFNEGPLPEVGGRWLAALRQRDLLPAREAVDAVDAAR